MYIIYINILFLCIKVGYLIIFYTKKKKILYKSKAQITNSKLTQTIFFKDSSHLIIGSWDGSLKIFNIKSKQILSIYSGDIHIFGLVNVFCY